MSLVVLKAIAPPNWATYAKPIALSKLLKKLANKNTSYATVYNFARVSYVLVRDREGEALYCKLPESQWLVINHIIYTTAFNCKCQICAWRENRQRYTSSLDFKHVTSKSINY